MRLSYHVGLLLLLFVIFLNFCYSLSILHTKYIIVKHILLISALLIVFLKVVYRKCVKMVRYCYLQKPYTLTITFASWVTLVVGYSVITWLRNKLLLLNFTSLLCVMILMFYYTLVYSAFLLHDLIKCDFRVADLCMEQNIMSLYSFTA